MNCLKKTLTIKCKEEKSQIEKQLHDASYIAEDVFQALRTKSCGRSARCRQRLLGEANNEETYQKVLLSLSSRMKLAAVTSPISKGKGLRTTTFSI